MRGPSQEGQGLPWHQCEGVHAGARVLEGTQHGRNGGLTSPSYTPGMQRWHTDPSADDTLTVRIVVCDS
jgi:hypothetical protein